MKSLIRLTFEIVIGNVSRSLDSPPENRTDRVKAGSTFEALLDVWGKDGVEDPESSIVRPRPCLRLECPHQFLQESPSIHESKVATGSTLRTLPGIHIPGTSSGKTSKYLLAPGSRHYLFLYHLRSIGLVVCVQLRKCTTLPPALSRF